MHALHRATVEQGSWGNMTDSHTSAAASVAIECTDCVHADRAAAMLQKLESWIGVYGRLVGKASAFER